MDYKFGTKNNWRRWQANRIAERVNPATATVLYLAGEQDQDRTLLKAKGFRDHNLIAVEREKKIVAELRDREILVAHGDLFDVLFSWPAQKRIDVVIGDFLCDLSRAMVSNIVFALMLPQCIETVFAFNFLKGRDSSLQSLRDGIGVVAIDYGCSPFRDPKHRGNILFMLLVMAAKLKLEEGLKCHFSEAECQEILQLENIKAELTHCLELNCLPVYNQYASTAGNQYFNSVVFKNRIFGDPSRPELSAVNMRWARDQVKVLTKRRVAAVAAHHTRRNILSGAR